MKAWFFACITLHAVMAQPIIPLMGAAKMGSKKIVLQHLACTHAPINEQDELGNSPLHYAVNIDSYEIARALLEHHADANLQNSAGLTPLHVAIKHRNQKIVRLLLRHGADPNRVDLHGNSPLHLTAAYAHTQCGVTIIDSLRTYGADPTLCNNANKTPHITIIEQPYNNLLPIHEKNLKAATTCLHANSYPQQSDLPIHPTSQRAYHTYAKKRQRRLT